MRFAKNLGRIAWNFTRDEFAGAEFYDLASRRYLFTHDNYYSLALHRQVMEKLVDFL